MATVTEERIAILEGEVAQIKAQLSGGRYGVIGRTNPQQLEKILSQTPPDEYTDAVWRSIETARDEEREEIRRQIREEEGA